LLPTCKECNRKKKDKLPYDYLDEFIYNECQNNLVTVLQKTTNIHEDKLQREEIVYNLVSSYGNKKINDKEFIISLCKLYNINMKKKVEIQLEHVNNNVSKNKKARFLDLYTQNKNINISKTCKLLGVSRSTIYNWITEVEK
jgi:transcriptional regulator with PAS, ATPase and Fis domain